VTAVVVPPHIDSTQIVRQAWKKYNLSLGLGLNKVAGKVFRIGHLGHLNEVSKPTIIYTYIYILYSRQRMDMYGVICEVETYVHGYA
jgi:aspartate aminotransferase-like enzyme